MSFTIRRIEPGDYAALHAIFGGPRVIWGTLQLPFPSAEAWRRRIAEPAPGMHSLVACDGSEVIGTLGLETFPNTPRRRHVGQFGMAVRDDRQGQGVGSALVRAAVDLADRWLNLERLELHVYTDNAAAVRLYQKFGFAIEGTFARYAFRDGGYTDAYAMARLRPDG